MKRNLLPLAIGAVIAMPSVALADGPKVYGKGVVTFGNEDNGSDDQWVVSSHASRFGVKGKESLSNNLSAVYKIEWEVDMTDGSTTLKSRNRYVGLSGDFGTIVGGLHDTPLKMSQGKIDQFNDLNADIKHVISGEVRAGNVLAYMSPKFGDAVDVKVALIPGEGEDVDGDGEADDGIADVFSGSATFSQGGIYASLAMDSAVGSYDRTRLTGGFKNDQFEAGILYQMAEMSEGDDEETGLVVSGAVNLGDVKLKAQFATSEMEDGDGNTTADKEQVTVGADYKLSKKTKLFAYYSTYEEKESNAEMDTLAAGISTKF